MPQARKSAAKKATEERAPEPQPTDRTPEPEPDAEPGRALLDNLQEQIKSRMEELEPLMREYTTLRNADLALSGALEPDPPRRRPGRPRAS